MTGGAYSAPASRLFSTRQVWIPRVPSREKSVRPIIQLSHRRKWIEPFDRAMDCRLGACSPYASITGLYSALRDFERPLVFPCPVTIQRVLRRPPEGSARSAGRVSATLGSSQYPVDDYSREIVHPYYLGYASSVPALVSKPVGYADSEILIPSGNAHASFQAKTAPVIFIISVLASRFST